jgi:hypothetical protein
MESIYNLYNYFMKYIINTNDDSSLDKSLDKSFDDEYTIIKDTPKDISMEPPKQSEDIIKPISIINKS